jgi:CheY-like chemotaxis protein
METTPETRDLDTPEKVLEALRVLLPVNIPELDGYAILRAIRSRIPAAPERAQPAVSDGWDGQPEALRAALTSAPQPQPPDATLRASLRAALDAFYAYRFGSVQEILDAAEALLAAPAAQPQDGLEAVREEVEGLLAPEYRPPALEALRAVLAILARHRQAQRSDAAEGKR